MIRQILIYTRPWEVSFHIELGKELLVCYPGAKLKYVTFFKDVHKLLIAKGFISVLFTEKINEIIELKDVSSIDEELQNSLDLNLNLLAGMERFMPKRQKDANEFVIKHAMILDQLVIENTLSISTMYDHFIYLLAGLLANIRNGYHFAFVMSGLPANRVIALKTPWETWQNKYPVELVSNLLEDSISKMTIPTSNRIGYMTIDWDIPVYKRFAKTFNNYFSEYADYKRGNYFVVPPLKRISSNVKVRLSKFFKHRDFYDISSEQELKNLSTKFFFCPLHMEPEATILMYSPWLRDQIEMCRLISQALPSNTVLLVKENPKMVNIRKAGYYRKLKKIPNIFLVAPCIESKKLIDKSFGVITLAGTASLEAAILGKNSMCFGVPPFSFLIPHSNIFNNNKIADLNKIFTKWLKDEKIPINISKWQSWVNGTLIGDLVPVKNLSKKEIEIPPKKETILNTSEYIKSIIGMESDCS